MLRNGVFSLGWTYTHYTPSGAGWVERKCPRARVTLGNAVRETSTLDPADHKMQVPLRGGLCGSGPTSPPNAASPSSRFTDQRETDRGHDKLGVVLEAMDRCENRKSRSGPNKKHTCMTTA